MLTTGYGTLERVLSTRSWMPSDKNSVCALSNQNGAYNIRESLYTYTYALFQEKSSKQILGMKRIMSVVHGCVVSPNDHVEENKDGTTQCIAWIELIETAETVCIIVDLPLLSFTHNDGHFL
jgi:hypothetical protein